MGENFWVSKRIRSDEDVISDDFVLSIIEPLFYSLEGREDVDRLHFLFHSPEELEGETVCDFRVFTENKKDISQEITDLDEHARINSVETDDWTPEKAGFNVAEADIITKHLEYTSKTALKTREERQKGNIRHFMKEKYGFNYPNILSYESNSDIRNQEPSQDIFQRHCHFFANQLGMEIFSHDLFEVEQETLLYQRFGE